MVSVEDESNGMEENSVEAYLNVEGPVNSRTASGVTLHRQESIYHVPKKRTAYVDVLMEGSGKVSILSYKTIVHALNIFTQGQTCLFVNMFPCDGRC